MVITSTGSVTFLATDHSVNQVCGFGPIGGDGGDWFIQ